MTTVIFQTKTKKINKVFYVNFYDPTTASFVIRAKVIRAIYRFISRLFAPVRHGVRRGSLLFWTKHIQKHIKKKIPSGKITKIFPGKKSFPDKVYWSRNLPIQPQIQIFEGAVFPKSVGKGSRPLSADLVVDEWEGVKGGMIVQQLSKSTGTAVTKLVIR